MVEALVIWWAAGLLYLTHEIEKVCSDVWAARRQARRDQLWPLRHDEE